MPNEHVNAPVAVDDQMNVWGSTRVLKPKDIAVVLTKTYLEAMVSNAVNTILQIPKGTERHLIVCGTMLMAEGLHNFRDQRSPILQRLMNACGCSNCLAWAKRGKEQMQ